MVGQQSPTVGGAEGSRSADAGGPRRGPNGKFLRPAAGDSAAACLYRHNTESKSEGVELLSAAGAHSPASLRGLDSYGQAAGDAGEPASRIDRSAGCRKKAGLEVSCG